MPFYLEMSKNITQQRDIYDKVIFRFLQIFYGLTMKRKVYKLYTTRSIKKTKRTKSRLKRKRKMLENSLCTSKTKEC